MCPSHGRASAFCRDGYLWYLVRLDDMTNEAFSDTKKESVSHGVMHLELSVKDEQGNVWPFQFDWYSKYSPSEKTVSVNKTAGLVTVSDIILTTTGLYVNYLGSKDNLLLVSVKLTDETVLYTNDEADSSTYANQAWDGWQLYDQVGAMGGYKYYSLLPGVSFRTDSSHADLISADDIVSVNINGVEISLIQK